jgi:hypothetical protein
MERGLGWLFLPVSFGRKEGKRGRNNSRVQVQSGFGMINPDREVVEGSLPKVSVSNPTWE